MIAIIDYGMGNLRSVQKALESLGQQAVITDDPAVLAQATHVILPGVGAFGDAMARLEETGLDQVVKQLAAQGKPLLGICLGMQMLFDESLEFGVHKGLGLILGRVVPMRGVIPEDFAIPQIGWNALDYTGVPSRLLEGTPEGTYVYFVHSYYGANCPEIIATAEYGADLTAAVAKGNVCGCQFHPEKSGNVGLGILKSFCEWRGEA